jgi:hypothetical protein
MDGFDGLQWDDAWLSLGNTPVLRVRRISWVHDPTSNCRPRLAEPVPEGGVGELFVWDSKLDGQVLEGQGPFHSSMVSLAA